MEQHGLLIVPPPPEDEELLLDEDEELLDEELLDEELLDEELLDEELLDEELLDEDEELLDGATPLLLPEALGTRVGPQHGEQFILKTVVVDISLRRN